MGGGGPVTPPTATAPGGSVRHRIGGGIHGASGAMAGQDQRFSDLARQQCEQQFWQTWRGGVAGGLGGAKFRQDPQALAALQQACPPAGAQPPAPAPAPSPSPSPTPGPGGPAPGGPGPVGPGGPAPGGPPGPPGVGAAPPPGGAPPPQMGIGDPRRRQMAPPPGSTPSSLTGR
jgi:hypothetical protein